MVQPFNCTNVLIEGPTFTRSPFWVIHPVYCDRLIIRNVTVIGGARYIGSVQLRKILDGVGGGYPGEPPWPCEQPSQEVGDDRRKPEPSAEEKAAGGDREQDEDFGRNHARVPLSGPSPTLEASVV